MALGTLSEVWGRMGARETGMTIFKLRDFNGYVLEVESRTTPPEAPLVPAPRVRHGGSMEDQP